MAKIKISYKDAMQEIEEIIAKLENNEYDIDQLSEKVKRVAELISHCKEKIKDTEEDIEKILGGIDLKD